MSSATSGEVVAAVKAARVSLSAAKAAAHTATVEAAGHAAAVKTGSGHAASVSATAVEASSAHAASVTATAMATSATVATAARHRRGCERKRERKRRHSNQFEIRHKCLLLILQNERHAARFVPKDASR